MIIPLVSSMLTCSELNRGNSKYMSPPVWNLRYACS